MDYYYINTNAKGVGVDKYKVWLKHNRAFTWGCKSYGCKSYGEELGKLQPQDICFMYVSGQGVRAVGKVLEPWDGKPCDPPMILNSCRENEYCLRVDWFIALSEPISPSDLQRNYRPPDTLVPLCNAFAIIKQQKNFSGLCDNTSTAR